MKQIKAFIFDMDGTILPGDQKISKRMVSILKQLIKNKYILTFATGRNYYFASEITDLFEENLLLGINNGSFILELPNKNIIYQQHLTTESIEETRLFFESHGYGSIVNATIHDEEKTFIFPSSLKSEAINNFVQNTRKNVHTINTLHDAGLQQLACLYCSIHSTLAPKIYEDLISKWPQKVFTLIKDPICKNYHWIGHMPQKTGKEYMYDVLLSKYAIQPQNVLAAGDDLNDMNMLKKAGVSIVMGNAPESLKKIGSQVIGTANEQALENFLEKNFLT